MTDDCVRNRYDSGLAPYAVSSCESGGRSHDEPGDPLRGPFELDRHRIIECTAFRRLERKTQVFAPARHDHFRTRLTHTLEVAHIARCLASALGANEALTEAIALAHDLGHPPFGHGGEAALNELLVDQGGFNHNDHSRRVVEHLEHPFPSHRGLNLTGETLAGLAAHATPYDVPGYKTSDPTGVADGPIGSSVEAMTVSAADRIAYDSHDLEDAIGADFVRPDDLDGVTIWRSAMKGIAVENRSNNIFAVRRVVLDSLLSAVLTDVVHASRVRLSSIQSPQQAKASTVPLVAPSSDLEKELAELEAFLLQRVYRRSEIAEMDALGSQTIRDLFDTFTRRPDLLPLRFASRIPDQGLETVVGDFIAGMTDGFCLAEHARLVRAPDAHEN